MLVPNTYRFGKISDLPPLDLAMCLAQVPLGLERH